MQDNKLIGASLTGFSVLLAVGILVVLLVVATAQTPDQFRTVDTHARYLEQAVTAVSRGVEVAESQQRLIDPDVGPLDQSLESGGGELRSMVTAIYAPVAILDVLRLEFMGWTNVIAPDAGELTDAELVLKSESVLSERLGRMRDELTEFSTAQVELEQVHGSFDQQVNGLISNLREDGRADAADSLYVYAGQVRAAIKKGAAGDLDDAIASSSRK